VIRRPWGLALMFIPLLGLQVISLAYYVREQGSLADYLKQVAKPSSLPSEQVKVIVLSFRGMPDAENDSYFLTPLFRFLRPTPWQVIEQGGECSDRSRLLIALLRLRGIHASKWALYNGQGQPTHAVVEADVESGKMVADPLFGLWFPKPQGGYYGIDDLRNDPRILPQRIDELRARGLQRGTDRLATYPIDQYPYTYARSINWNKSAVFEFTYRLLRRVLGNGVDDLPRPSFTSEPPLMVVCGAATLELVVILAWFIVARMQRGRSARAHSGYAFAGSEGPGGRSMPRESSVRLAQENSSSPR
jgi:hypothetical protein